MKTLTDYLETIKEKKGFEKDVELADFLGIKRASLSVMKHGGGASQETAERIAEGANVALEEVWLASLIQKEQNPRFKSVLENISKLSGLAASLLITCVLVGYNAKEADAAVVYNLTSYTLCEVFDSVWRSSCVSLAPIHYESKS